MWVVGQLNSFHHIIIQPCDYLTRATSIGKIHHWASPSCEGLIWISIGTGYISSESNLCKLLYHVVIPNDVSLSFTRIESKAAWQVYNVWQANCVHCSSFFQTSFHESHLILVACQLWLHANFGCMSTYNHWYKGHNL